MGMYASLNVCASLNMCASRHVPPRQVLVFEGQPQNPEDSHLVTTPADLARHDIVLTTYEVLRQELHKHQAADVAGATRGRRTAQRYHVRMCVLFYVVSCGLAWNVE